MPEFWYTQEVALTQTLGKLHDGRAVDLREFLYRARSHAEGFETLVRPVIRMHPEWQALADQALELYLPSIAHMQPAPESFETSRQLGIPIGTVMAANAASIVALMGLSHFLESQDFGIRNPSDFTELSVKLEFARDLVAYIGFDAVQRRIIRWLPQSGTYASHRAKACYRHCFSLGLSVGYLIADLHSQSPTVTAQFLCV
jgi:hypothetical protein